MYMYIHILDVIAIGIFFSAWFGYSYFARTHTSRNLVNALHRYRIRWMKAMIRRVDRLVDLRILGNLVSTTTFLASTSILIIGGLMALLGYGEKAISILNTLPFRVETTMFMWLVKTSLLLVIFIHSFFKFTWVIRQFNYATVLMVAAPLYKADPKDIHNTKESARYVHRIANMISNSSAHFNMGVRTYYFGLVALSWYVGPLLLIFLSILVILVLYRREFRSKTLMLLE